MEKQRVLIAIILALVLGAVAFLTYPLLQNPPQSPIQLGLDLRGGSQLTIQLKTTEKVPEITQDKLEGVQAVISNRVNSLGVSEAVVQSVGNDRILVQLPGVSNPEEAERVLGGTAQLEFRVETDNPETQAELDIRQQELIEILTQQLENPDNEEIQSQLVAKQQEIEEIRKKLFEEAELSGKNLTNARHQPIPNSDNWEVAITFDNEGAAKFAELTKRIAGTGRGLGIFLDDELISAPRVDAQYRQRGIEGGMAVVSGNFGIQEARELALQLKGGALPVPVEIVENRTVGASLGQDSIRRSIIAGVAGLALVLIYVAVYYRLPGIIADVALLIYTILTLSAYSLIGVTLTLPGIAGFILSIGMAVDANVLIFERTREELRKGKTLYRSVESGFYRAFSSILDSNVTTLIACAALFWLGSGLVKGFALTLATGVVVSMFTAVTCSRTLLLFTVLGVPGIRKKPELFCPNLPVNN